MLAAVWGFVKASRSVRLFVAVTSMRFRISFAGSAVCLIGLAFPASSQTSPGGNTTSQVSKTWEVGRGLAEQLDPFVRHVEHKDPPVEFLGDYVQRVEDRIAGAAGVKPNEIRITWGVKWYGFLVPDRRLYLSIGLLERISSEGELAGLLSHELAHANPKLGTEFEQCALAAGYLPVQRNPRASEGLATQRAIGYMKASGFDPSAMLDVFSKIAYENQRWSKAIVAEDLLKLRVALEAEPEPAGGYAIDGSEFAKFHAKLPVVVERPGSTILRRRPNQ
jgi:predicted Zn-dependent protease